MSNFNREADTFIREFLTMEPNNGIARATMRQPMHLDRDYSPD